MPFNEFSNLGNAPLPDWEEKKFPRRADCDVPQRVELGMGSTKMCP